MPSPITDVREISRIAYGFMGSKALFAALNLDLFGHLAGSKKTFEMLVDQTKVAPNRLRTILVALLAVGLIVREDDEYRTLRRASGIWCVVRLPTSETTTGSRSIARCSLPCCIWIQVLLEIHRTSRSIHSRD